MRNLLVWVFGYLFGIAGAAAQTVVSVGWDDYPPYQMSTAGDRQGIDMDIVRTALKRAGYEVKFVQLPWARQLLKLEKGELAIAMSASKSEDRSVYAVWSDIYRAERTALIALRSNQASVTSLSQLLGTNVRIGVIRDSSFPGEYASLLPNPEFQRLLVLATLNLQNLGKLRLGRIDYLIDDPVTIQYQAQLSPGPEVRVVLEMENEGSHFMVGKKFVAGEKDFLLRLNTALSAMKREGVIHQIFRQYGAPK